MSHSVLQKNPESLGCFSAVSDMHVRNSWILGEISGELSMPVWMIQIHFVWGYNWAYHIDMLNVEGDK
jgi:hypothetical protein